MGEGVRVGSLADLPVEEPFEGVRRSSFDSEQATVNVYVFAPGARFPLHRHREEQVTLVEEGEVEFTAEGRRSRLAAGHWSVLGPDVEHGVVAGPEGARVLAIVIPRRTSPGAYTVVEGSPCSHRPTP